ncbi:MAG: NifU family protein [Candidatus Omnitrophica bacterium]|nr:NifU family protein [Candidatus Omnitrophota bacterium]
MENEIRNVLEMDVKPALAADGGSIEFVSLEGDGIVNVKLQGACAGCPGAQMTLKMGVERILKEKVPGVKQVNAV